MMHLNQQTDYRLVLPRAVRGPESEKVKIFNFIPIKAHTFASERLKQSAYAKIGDSKVLLCSLVREVNEGSKPVDKVEVVLASTDCNVQINKMANGFPQTPLLLKTSVEENHMLTQVYSNSNFAIFAL